MTDWVNIGFGLVLLIAGGEMLVRGAVNLALRLGIPALIVGLTVVAFGTSAPELLVSVNAALDGVPGIALGNVVGSNIVNILLILGIPAIITTIHSSTSDTGRSYVMMVATSVLLIVLCFAGPLSLWHGVVLLAGLAFMLWDNIRQARAHISETDIAAEAKIEGQDGHMPAWQIGLFIVAGLAALGFGADFLVTGAVEIARDLGVSDTVIGLTLVAIGTSLPELVTSIIAALRKQADVAMGNVIGSNLFNILAILGITSVISPLEVAPTFLTLDLWVMLGVALLLAPFALFRRDIGRAVGLGFIGIWAVYTVVLVLMSSGTVA